MWLPIVSKFGVVSKFWGELGALLAGTTIALILLIWRLMAQDWGGMFAMLGAFVTGIVAIGVALVAARLER